MTASGDPVPGSATTLVYPTEAVRELTKREYRGIAEENIDRWSETNIGRWSEGNPDPTDIPGLSVWAAGRGIQHVIWTALGPKFCDLPVAPTDDQAVAFLRRLSDEGRAAEAEKYVRRAPPQIDTAYRRRIVRCLDWTPVV